MDKKLDPRHLDVLAFAQSGLSLQGQSPLAQWPRLVDEQTAPAPMHTNPVQWHLQGQTTPVTAGAPRVGMVLSAQADLPMQCQRCLTLVVQRIEVRRTFVFVADESTAAALDEESEDDVLVMSRDFDALSLIEDELILALPLVPRHEVCPQDVPLGAADEGFDAASQGPNPFAALQVLKKGQ